MPARWILAPSLEHLFQDLRAGARIVTGSPGLTAAAVILMALVIGGNTTVFTVVHGILTKPAAGVTARNLVTFNWASPRWIEPGTSYPTYRDLAAQSTLLESIVAVQAERLTISTNDTSDGAWGAMVTPNYFDAYGVPMAIGRGIAAADNDRATSGLVAVISHNYWRRVFGGASDIAGRAIHVNGVPATIVGVAAAPFRGGRLAPAVDVWVPIVSFARAVGDDEILTERKDVRVEVIGRLREGVPRTRAEREMAAVWSRLAEVHPEIDQDFRLQLLPYSGTAGGNALISTQSDTFLAIFSILTAITLLVVCANVANLLIARGVTRQLELALRQSLGASRVRIVRMLVGEGLAIAVLAWICSYASAWVLSRGLDGILAPAGTDIGPVDLTPDWTVAGYALLLALAGVLAFSLAPSLRAWRQPLLPSLKAGEQGVVRGQSRLTKSLVVMQLAFSVLLLVTAGLACRSMALLGNTDLGYSTNGLLLVTVRTLASATTPAAHAALIDRLRQPISVVPGVTAASYSSSAPREFWGRDSVRLAGAETAVPAEVTQVGPGYFEALGLPLIAGRDVDASGRTATVVITAGLAESLWPGRTALGQELVFDRSGRRATIVGIARDAFYGGYRRTARPPVAFLSFADQPGPPGEATLYIRHTETLERVVADVRRTVQAVDPNVPIVAARTLDAQLQTILYPLRLITRLLMLFGAVSLIIATLGQYASMTFEMRRRVREVGVRMATGASAGQVLRGVLSDGLRSTAAGLLIGFGLSVALATALAGALYGITPTDYVTYGGVFLLLTISSLAACLLPAQRAARQDPMRALRYE